MIKNKHLTALEQFEIFLAQELGVKLYEYKVFFNENSFGFGFSNPYPPCSFGYNYNSTVYEEIKQKELKRFEFRKKYYNYLKSKGVVI